MSSTPLRQTKNVIGTPIDVVDWATALDRIDLWGRGRESRYICICNAHSLVTATREPDFADALGAADMATPDGAPVAWMLRYLGARGQQRINGPDLMMRYCQRAEKTGTAIYLFGSTNATLMQLRQTLALRFPRLQVAGSQSPSFGGITVREAQTQVDLINRSGARVVFVSLGCPKQELWMAANKCKVQAVMIGVGAAFDFHAGTLQRAPAWMRNTGLEWLHRLHSEPRRLWRRYLVTNTLFVMRAVPQLFRRSD